MTEFVDNPVQIIQDYTDASAGKAYVQKPDTTDVQHAIDQLDDLVAAVGHIPFWGRVIKQMVKNGHKDLARVLVQFGGPRPHTGDAELVDLDQET